MGEAKSVRFQFSIEDRRSTAKKAVSYNIRRVKGAGVLLVLLLNLLVFSYQSSALSSLVDLVVSSLNSKGDDVSTTEGILDEPWVRAIISALLYGSLPKILYPFAGWLADAKLGRYKVIRYSLWMMWVGSALLILTSIVSYILAMNWPSSDAWGYIVNFTVPVYAIIYLITAMGTAGYHVNIIPFGIDQMEGASSEAISSFVHWYYWTRNFNFGMIMQFLLQFNAKFSCNEIKRQRNYDCKVLDFYVMLFQMLFITAAVCVDFTLSSKLHKDPKIHSTVKKVKDITAFILRHDQPVGHRKAKTFTFEAPPARSDFAKEPYGGPFKDDEVEEVMSFWRIIVILLVSGFGIFIIRTGHYTYPSFYEHMGKSKFSPSESTDFFSIMTFTLCIPIFEFLIYPFFRNWIPRTTIRIGIGMFVVLLGLSSMLIMDAALPHHTEHGTACMFYTEGNNIHEDAAILGIVIVTMAIGELLVFLSTLEFICAQAPYSMRGLMIGIFYMIHSLSVVVVCAVLVVFAKGMENSWKGDIKGSCGTWYIMTVIIIGFVGTVLYIIAAKRYKKRQRGGQQDVNQQTVVEGYHER